MMKMDREKKRSETGTSPEHDRVTKKGKLTVTAISERFSYDDDDYIQKPDSYSPFGVFEFPWQKDEGSLAPELDGCSLREVFYSSLVDGISPSTLSPITISGEADESMSSDGDVDGVDCIWNWALRRPLSVLYWKSSGA